MLDRKSAPQFVEVKDFQLPTANIDALSNGIRIVNFNEVNQEAVKLELVFAAGKWHEPERGIAQFTAQMLEKGTSSKNSYQIAEHFDRFGASIEINPGFDYTTVSLYTLSKNLKDVLPLFSEITQAPSFPESEISLATSITRQNLKINNEKTSYVAGKKFRELIFGSHHPYGSSLEESDLIAINRNKLIEFFNSKFRLHEVYLTGQLERASYDRVREAVLGYSAKGSNGINRIVNESTERNHSLYSERPDSIQSSLRLGKKIINRSSPDYPTITLLNHLLGGYFGSRLMKNIREEKGLTYGIHSSISALKHDAFFVIGTDVNKENRKSALEEIRKEVAALNEKPINSTEFELGRNHLLGSLQLETANPFAVMEKIKTIRLNQLSTDFYSQLFTNLQETDSIALQEVAQKYLGVDSLFEVSVG